MRDRNEFRLVIALCVALFFVAARYLLQPLRFRERQRFAARPELRPLDPSQKLPDKVDIYLKRVEDSLHARGFDRLGDYALANFADRVAGTNRLFVDRVKRNMAGVTIGYLKGANGEWNINQTVIAFRTDFADGSTLITSNFKLINAVPPRPNVTTYRFVRIKDPSVLHKIHEGILARFFEAKIRDLVLDSKFAGDATALAQWQSAEEIGRLADSGYYYHDEATDKLRPTLKGAYLAVWKNSWPWKELRERRRDAEARRVLRDLGLDAEGRGDKV
jgi:hypothetical protein